MTLFSTSTISLNLFMEIILSLTWHIYCHSYYLFSFFIPNIHYSSKRHYFDPMCCFFLFFLFIIIVLIIYFYLRGFTVFVNELWIWRSLWALMISTSAMELGSGDDFWVWWDAVFVNDLCCSRSLWTLKISPSAVELGSGDDFWVWRDAVFVNDFWFWRSLWELKIQRQPWN